MLYNSMHTSHAPFHGQQVKEFAPNYDDLHGYLESPENDLAHWSMFNQNITSSEPDVRTVFKYLRECKEELFDLRPYMID